MRIKPAASVNPFVLVAHEGFEYLAVIQNRMQIGALAVTPEGRYVQVNGAVVQPLNQYRVLRALKKAFPYKDWGIRATRAVAAPVVTVRRRRRVPVTNTLP